MNRIKIVDFLQSSLSRIGVRSLIGYTESRDIATLGATDFITKEMISGIGVSKVIVSKTGADIDMDGFINVSSDVDNTSDLIGAYINMRPTYSPIFFDPTDLKVGPFDTSTPSGDNILLRFIPGGTEPPGPSTGSFPYLLPYQLTLFITISISILKWQL